MARVSLSRPLSLPLVKCIWSGERNRHAVRVWAWVCLCISFSCQRVFVVSFYIRTNFSLLFQSLWFLFSCSPPPTSTSSISIRCMVLHHFHFTFQSLQVKMCDFSFSISNKRTNERKTDHWYGWNCLKSKTLLLHMIKELFFSPIFLNISNIFQQLQKERKNKNEIQCEISFLHKNENHFTYFSLAYVSFCWCCCCCCSCDCALKKNQHKNIHRTNGDTKKCAASLIYIGTYSRLFHISFVIQIYLCVCVHLLPSTFYIVIIISKEMERNNYFVWKSICTIHNQMK